MKERASGEDRGQMEGHKLLLAANCAAIASLVPVVLYQLRAVEHLPDPPSAVFDSDRITGSRTAHPFGVPDGLLGLASYGTTLALGVMACKSQVARRALAGKLVMDGGVAAFNATRQIVRFGRVCSWCMGTVAATALMFYAGRALISTELSRATKR